MQNQRRLQACIVRDTAEYRETTAPINTYVLRLTNSISDALKFSILIDRFD